MAKRKEAIGLDIGANAIKMARIVNAGASVEILDYKIREIREGEEKADVIAEVLKGIGNINKDTPVIVSIEGSHTFIRVFKLPGVAKGKLAKIVEYEAQQQVPFPINEVVWSYQCLRRVTPEETDVVLAAVKSSVIDDLLSVIKIDAADIVPPVIGLNNILSWNKYADIQDLSGQAVMVLDLGARTTNVIVLEKDNLWFRTIPIGCEAITQGLSSEYNIGFNDAEVLKKEKGNIILEGEPEGDNEVRRISTCIIKSLTRLTGEISRSMEVYSSSFNSLGPRKIFVTGGGAELKNLTAFLSKKFRIDVEVLRGIKNVNISGALEKTRIAKGLTRLYTALGLAVQGLGYGKIGLSLLPKEIVKRHTLKNMQMYAAAVSGMFIFLSACFSFYNIQFAGMYKAEISKIQSEIKAADINSGQLIKTQKDIDAAANRLDKILDVKDARNFWLNMLLELEKILPNNIWLTGVEPVHLEAASKDKKGQNIFTRDQDKTKKDSVDEYSKYTIGTINLRFSGKTTGAYQDIVTFNDMLNSSKYFIKNTAKVLSANPPVDGIRDFIIDAKAAPIRKNE